jgi:hypothetical protein
MTKTLISTSEVNRAIKDIKPSKVYSSAELKNLGFEPTFETNHGTYWDEDTGKRLFMLLKEGKTDHDKELNDAYDDGYKKGRMAGIQSGMRNMHSLLIEYLMDTHNELAQEIQYVSDGFLRPLVPESLNEPK